MEGRTRIVLEVPLRTTKHVTMVDKTHFQSVCRALSENGLTVVLMIGPNIEKIHPPKCLPIRNHDDSRKAYLLCWPVWQRSGLDRHLYHIVPAVIGDQWMEPHGILLSALCPHLSDLGSQNIST